LQNKLMVVFPERKVIVSFPSLMESRAVAINPEKSVEISEKSRPSTLLFWLLWTLQDN
jgi:hypothetical protein